MLSAILEEGNVFVYATVMAMFVLVAIGIERFYTLFFRYRLRVAPFRKALEQALQEMDLNKALRIASLNQAHPVCRAARAGLMKANQGDKEVVRAMEVATLESMPRIQGWTTYLAMLGNLGTLMGLIGTVFGMIEAFKGLGVSDSGAKQEILARGIALAMNSTALGLIVAIPGTLLATLFSHRQERLLDHVEEVTLTVASYLNQASKEAARRSGAGGGRA
jgi:biopolymer transport protein ExbB